VEPCHRRQQLSSKHVIRSPHSSEPNGHVVMAFLARGIQRGLVKIVRGVNIVDRTHFNRSLGHADVTVKASGVHGNVPANVFGAYFSART